MRTANSLFSYDQIYLGKTLDDHTNDVYALMAKKCGWGNKRLMIGMFGYDNLIMSLGYVFKHCPDKLNSNEIAKYAHKGWADNYIYWRDQKPWLNNKIYKKPHNNLGDPRRNELAKTPYHKLPEEEKQTNIIIAEYVIDLLTPKKIVMPKN